MSSPSVPSMEEASDFFLDCARYGDVEDLLSCIAFGVDINFKDASGNTALHKAAANGEISCMQILKDNNILYCQNSSGNTPLHWAVQNQKLESAKFLIDNFVGLDVLQQNASGRGALTDAFQTGNVELINLCLSHPSSSEDKLLDKMDSENVKLTDNTVVAGADETQSITHEFTLSVDPLYDGKTVFIRELPIKNPDNPFGTDTAPEDDTTVVLTLKLGLGIWAASLLLSRYILQLGPDLFNGKVIIELGAGCGIPGIVAATYCTPKSVYITDINEASLSNALYNANLNGVHKTSISDEPSDHPIGVAEICRVNWLDPTTFPPEKADIILGSDLVYDSKIISILIPAIMAMLSENGVLLYSCLASERDGMSEFVPTLAEAGLVLVEHFLCPDSFYSNPLTTQDADNYVLHFNEMFLQKEHQLFRFQKLSTC